MAAVLDAGADVDERDTSGNTPLHVVAFFGRDEAGRLLLARGGDGSARNVSGRLPAAMLALPADVAAEFAPLVGLDALAVDDVLEGRARLSGMLPAGPNAEGTEGGVLDRITLAWSRTLSSERLRVRFGGRSLHLVQTNVFDHLWFLWFLCWLVGLFALLATTGLLPSGRGRWWLVPASCLPQAVTGLSLAGSFGPDTSLGILPKPHVLAFYACFFFFGVATHAAEGLDARLGSRWRILLPAAVVLLAAGIATMNDRLSATLLQPAYAWTMSLGLIGLFCRLFPEPRPTVTWLADASYWIYLVHLPLVGLGQVWLHAQPWPPVAKMLVVSAWAAVVGVISYQLLVRHTVIGWVLHGSRSGEPRAGTEKSTGVQPSLAADTIPAPHLPASRPRTRSRHELRPPV